MKQPNTPTRPSSWNSISIPDVPELSLTQARSDVLRTLLRVAWPLVTCLTVVAVALALHYDDLAGAISYVLGWLAFVGVFFLRHHTNQGVPAMALVMLTAVIGISLLMDELAPLGLLWLACVPLMSAVLLGRRATGISIVLVAAVAYLGAGLAEISFRPTRFEHLPLVVWGLLALNFVALYGPVGMAAARLLKRLDVALTQTRSVQVQTHRLAHTDVLTGLPNLLQLRHDLAQYTGSGATGAVPALLAYLDLNDLRRVNDLHGRQVGDNYVVETARHLVAGSPASSTVYRSGGAEFIALIQIDASAEAIERAAMAMQWAEQLQTHLKQPVTIQDLGEVKTSVNIGISLLDSPNLTADGALQEAAIALSKTRTVGRSRVAVFHRSMLRDLWEQAQLEHDLELAFRANRLHIEVQSQVDCQGKVVGAELLSRWTDPVRGPISPGLFIPAAEKTGLIVPLGDWVLEQACELALILMARQIDIPLSVNVSLRQFEDPGFENRLHSLLRRANVPANRLMLEITESVLLSDQVDVIGMLNRLAQAGLRFSIDDFGTGYSSLSYLKKLPLSELKIDRSFVANLPDDPNDGTLVSIMVVLAETLDLRLVAEGIETAAQVEFLSHMGCQVFQGYHFARPIPASQWLDTLDATAPHTDDRTG